jgi:nucleotide-binding universal stress UspA family protein
MAYKRILVPVDGSPTSGLGLREAIGLAKAQKARLQLVHVVDLHSASMAGAESNAYLADLVQAMTQRGRRILAKTAERARKAGLACDTALLETLAGPAAEPILRQAKKRASISS